MFLPKLPQFNFCKTRKKVQKLIIYFSHIFFKFSFSHFLFFIRTKSPSIKNRLGALCPKSSILPYHSGHFMKFFTKMLFVVHKFLKKKIILNFCNIQINFFPTWSISLQIL